MFPLALHVVEVAMCAREGGVMRFVLDGQEPSQLMMKLDRLYNSGKELLPEIK